MFYKNLFIIAMNFTCILVCILYHVIALHADFYVLCQKWRIKDVQSIIVGSQCASSGLPVIFQWLSSGLPVCFNYAINTGSPLGHHWVLASASVVPVASQCTCGSSGNPAWSVQWYPSVLTESGLEVIRSGHFPACDTLCIQLVLWELFELNWFHLTCNPKYTKTVMVLISKHAQSNVEVLTCVKSRTGIHCRAVNSK